MGSNIVLVCLIVLYFTPAMVAVGRNHHSQMAVIVVNVFLGWTLIGWVVALAWACTAIRRPA